MLKKIKNKLLDIRDFILDRFDDLCDWWDSLDRKKRTTILVCLMTIVLVVVIFSVAKCSTIGNQEQTQDLAALNTGANDKIEATSYISEEEANALGFDLDRYKKDETTIKDFCAAAFNFATQEEYASVRSKLSEKYPSVDTWQFGREYMTSQMFVGDSYGLEFKQVEAYVTKVEGGVYEYTCDVVVRVKSQNSGQSSGNVLMIVKTSDAGEIIDCSAATTTTMR